MPKVFQKVAKFDTYHLGALLDDPKTKSGKRVDRSKPRDEKDTIEFKKGEVYYEWTLFNSPTRRSKTYPTRQQLTSSEFLCSVYDIDDEIKAIDTNTVEELGDDTLSEIISRLEELRDETEEKLDNMPEQLQEAPTGQLLSERIEGLDEWVSELEGVDLSVDEELEEGEKLERLEEIVEEINGIDPPF